MKSGQWPLQQPGPFPNSSPEVRCPFEQVLAVSGTWVFPWEGRHPHPPPPGPWPTASLVPMPTPHAAGRTGCHFHLTNESAKIRGGEGARAPASLPSASVQGGASPAVPLLLVPGMQRANTSHQLSFFQKPGLLRSPWGCRCPLSLHHGPEPARTSRASLCAETGRNPGLAGIATGSLGFLGGPCNLRVHWAKGPRAPSKADTSQRARPAGVLPARYGWAPGGTWKRGGDGRPSYTVVGLREMGALLAPTGVLLFGWLFIALVSMQLVL